MLGSVCYTFGAFELDTGLRELRAAGAPVRLTAKDVDVLLVLVERRGELVEKEALFAAVWGGVVVEDCNLARHVANLRKALADDAERPTFIETIPRRGYRFLASVTTAARQVPAAHPTDPPPPDLVARPPPPAPTSRRAPGIMGRLGRGALVLGVLVLLPAATWLAGQGRGHGAMRSLAVLPVANLTGDARHDHLADTLGEMTINDLGRLRWSRQEPLRVLPRSATAGYRAAPVTSSRAAGELGVDGLLEAALLQAEGRVRISALLVDARSGAVVWAHEVEGAADAFMALQDELVFALAGHLGLQLGPGDLPLAGQRSAGSPEAHATAAVGTEGAPRALLH
jgi:DNA-binding winged helix-turn-helix (wHTH) protein/TolB-like protein